MALTLTLALLTTCVILRVQQYQHDHGRRNTLAPRVLLSALGDYIGLCNLCHDTRSGGCLFVAGGSLKRLREQEAMLKEEGTVGLKRALEPRPMLYDELLEASRCLPAVPTFGQRGSLEGKFVRLTVLDANARKSVVRQLYEASNGLPGLLGPAYDPHTVWRYLPFGPFETEQSMEAFMVLK